MLAQPGVPPLTTSASWAWEVKWDGNARPAAPRSRPSLSASRGGRDFTDGFPSPSCSWTELRPTRCSVDGELVCLAAHGGPDFSCLRGRLLARTPAAVARAATAAPAKFIAFDVLHLDGEPLRALPYADRRQVLDALELAVDAWQPPRWFADGTALVEATREQLLERASRWPACAALPAPH